MSQPKRQMKLYLLHVYGCVEPRLLGPYGTEASRVRAAKRLAKVEQDAVFRLDAYEKPVVYCFSSMETARQ